MTKPEDREAFKVNFHKLVDQSAQTFSQTDSRPLKIVFEDKAYFGRINDLKRC